MELYQSSLRMPSPVQVSHGQTPDTPYFSAYVWEPHGRFIVFALDRGGNEQFALHKMDMRGRLRPFWNSPPGQNLPLEFSPDGRWLLVASDRRNPCGIRKLELWRVASDSGYWTVVSRHRQPPDLWWTTSFWNPDCKRIAYAASDSTDTNDAAVFVASLDGERARAVFHSDDGVRDFPGAWHPDGRHLSITSESTGRQTAGVLDTETGTVSWFGKTKHDEIAVGFSRDGRRLAVTRFCGVDTIPVVYDLLTGVAHLPSDRKGVVTRPEFDAGGQDLLYLKDDPIHRTSIVRWNIDSGRKRNLVDSSAHTVPYRPLVSPTAVMYAGRAGRKIQALLYRPSSRRSGGLFPAIVNTHGGPTAQFQRKWDPVAQLLCILGFVLIQPNVRGSTGYGIEFRDSNKMDIGGGDLQDVVAAGRYLQSLPYVNPSRIGIYGASYGGYLAYLALVKSPKMWAAGCAVNGITDWHSQYASETPELQQYDRAHLGDPETNVDLWVDRSPINFVQEIRAKLMIVHGANDPRCPIGQARAFRDRLASLGRREGRDFEYMEVPGVGHSTADTQARALILERIGDFFLRTL